MAFMCLPIWASKGLSAVLFLELAVVNTCSRQDKVLFGCMCATMAHYHHAVDMRIHVCRSTSVQSKASSDETRSLSEASMNGRSSDEHLSISQQPSTHTSAVQSTAAVTHTRVSELAVSDEDDDAITSECTSSDASLQVCMHCVT